MAYFDPYELPQYNLSTAADLNLKLGKVVNRDTQTEVSALTLAPVRCLISRTLWQNSKLECESPDGITGSVYGSCRTCRLSVEECQSYIRVLCVAQPDFPEETESGLFWFTFSIRPTNPFHRPRNATFYKALQTALVEENAVVCRTKVASNKNSSIHWTVIDESAESLTSVPRETDPPQDAVVLGIWNSDIS